MEITSQRRQGEPRDQSRVNTWVFRARENCSVEVAVLTFSRSRFHVVAAATANARSEVLFGVSFNHCVDHWAVVIPGCCLQLVSFERMLLSLVYTVIGLCCVLLFVAKLSFRMSVDFFCYCFTCTAVLLARLWMCVCVSQTHRRRRVGITCLRGVGSGTKPSAALFHCSPDRSLRGNS